MTSDGDKPTQRLRAGEWLRAQREQAGYASAAELGRAIGTTKEVIWSYEKGRASVPDDRAEKIAVVLKLDIITVRRNLGLWVPDAPASDEGKVESPEVRAMRERFERIAEDQRKLRDLDLAMEIIERREAN